MEILMKEIVFGLGRQVLGSIVSNLNIIFLFGHYGLVGCDAKSMTYHLHNKGKWNIHGCSYTGSKFKRTADCNTCAKVNPWPSMGALCCIGQSGLENQNHLHQVDTYVLA